MSLFSRGERDPYQSVRFTLFGINIGALLAVWATLLIVVYSLMYHELYEVLDNQLQLTATRIIRNYDRHHAGVPLGPVILADQQESFSLWFIAHEHSDWTAAYMDGNPFVNVRLMYRRALGNPTGSYETISTNGAPYRAFYALVDTPRGTYLIRVIQPEGPTNATLSRLLRTLTVAGFAALFLTIAIGLWLSERSLSPMIASWRRQQQFVADASHELRTPLTIIKTNLDVLLRHPEHTIETELNFLANAYSEVNRTSSLIEDLLTLARADSKEALIEEHPVDVGALATEVADTVLPMAEQQEKTISVSVPASSCQTLGDVNRLRQLLLILIDNALRYSNAGGSIHLTVKCDTLYTTIAVSDTGIGIAPKLLPRIFDRFVRGDETRMRHEQGSGLGLSIAKWIVEAHRGTITAQSTVGKGTTFTITLPH
ncbi:MAG: HAMP domain-containing sensor histidine kinase [Firmicutes bacterium]|nr:HAMP domain-containing sensor histidine kinase [Bacillota bacterium]